MFGAGVAPGLWSGLVASLISTNRFFGLGGFLPLSSVDSEVIWRELFKPISTGLKKRVESETNKISPPSPTSRGNH